MPSSSGKFSYFIAELISSFLSVLSFRNFVIWKMNVLNKFSDLDLISQFSITAFLLFFWEYFLKMIFQSSVEFFFFFLLFLFLISKDSFFIPWLMVVVHLLL